MHNGIWIAGTGYNYRGGGKMRFLDSLDDMTDMSLVERNKKNKSKEIKSKSYDVNDKRVNPVGDGHGLRVGDSYQENGGNR